MREVNATTCDDMYLVDHSTDHQAMMQTLESFDRFLVLSAVDHLIIFWDIMATALNISKSKNVASTESRNYCNLRIVVLHIRISKYELKYPTRICHLLCVIVALSETIRAMSLLTESTNKVIVKRVIKRLCVVNLIEATQRPTFPTDHIE